MDFFYKVFEREREFFTKREGGGGVAARVSIFSVLFYVKEFPCREWSGMAHVING